MKPNPVDAILVPVATREPGSAGAGILIPGYPQWSWRQRERGLVLFGSYITALGVGIFAWGTMTGLLVLLFAFVTHSYAAADAIRQFSFPGFGRVVPTVTASAGLGTLYYGPMLAVATVFAWPVAPDERPREGYLVNRWAYGSGRDPGPGEMIWLKPARGARPRVARVIAGPGQQLEWAGNRLLVNGRPVLGSPFRTMGSPGELKMTIPTGHVLVSFGLEPAETQALLGGWEVIDRADVWGQAWARSYPVLNRQFLR